ncbi:hypothetical protein BC831DRAFT_455629, partial [Entophlyctis helioformis]
MTGDCSVCIRRVVVHQHTASPSRQSTASPRTQIPVPAAPNLGHNRHRHETPHAQPFQPRCRGIRVGRTRLAASPARSSCSCECLLGC